MGMNGAGISGTDTDGALPLHFVSFYFQLTNFISYVPTNQHPYAHRQNRNDMVARQGTVTHCTGYV